MMREETDEKNDKFAILKYFFVATTHRWDSHIRSHAHVHFLDNPQKLGQGSVVAILTLETWKS